jgi:hypothetical protein
MNMEPKKLDPWLQRLVGEWMYEAEDTSSTDKPPEPFRGTETVRALGGPWLLLEGRSDAAATVQSTSLMTIGFDPDKSSYVGTFVSSMMSYLWIYRGGQFDAGRKILTLESEGPSFTDDKKLSQYRDLLEYKSDDQRTMSSEVLGDDGKWKRFMVMSYRRRK